MPEETKPTPAMSVTTRDSTVRCDICGRVDNVHGPSGTSEDGFHQFISRATASRLARELTAKIFDDALGKFMRAEPFSSEEITEVYSVIRETVFFQERNDGD